MRKGTIWKKQYLPVGMIRLGKGVTGLFPRSKDLTEASRLIDETVFEAIKLVGDLHHILLNFLVGDTRIDLCCFNVGMSQHL